MATPNPLLNTHSSPPPPVSSQTHHIAGILTTVQGIAELPESCDSISILWLLHPRLGTKEIMAPVGSSTIHSWNQRRHSNSKKGLIAVSFDQRNHGTREVNKLANEAWRGGNPTHAQDMFSVYHGTAVDMSILMDHLGAYIFVEPGAPAIERHFVLGVSLGGHAAWQVFFREPRVEAAVVIIGCPDYMRVMSDRARLSKLKTYTSDNGASFLGSKDFPAALIESVKKSDPRGLLFATQEIQSSTSLEEQQRLRSILDSTIKGKSVLICSGGADKLVPYHCSKPLLDFLKPAVSSKGWYSDGNVYVEDVIYDGIGHAMSDGMVRDSMRFIGDLMEGKQMHSSSKSSKM